ncbi:hypothetical protein NAL19_1826 [Pectobacterium sp. F1-1]|nr:hypothetical protein NAL19_1826 [Pectobacterium sp. F1-1]
MVARFYHGIVAQYSVSYVPFLTMFLSLRQLLVYVLTSLWCERCFLFNNAVFTATGMRQT